MLNIFDILIDLPEAMSKIFYIGRLAVSFREKSAWVMALLTAAGGLWYLEKLVALSPSLSQTPAPLGLILRYVIGMVIVSVIAQIALAVMTPNEAEAPADERERAVLRRAGSWSGDVLAAGILAALAWFVARGDGNLLFHMAFASLIIAQVCEYLVQGVLLRRGA